jgi:hypothetical protein
MNTNTKTPLDFLPRLPLWSFRMLPNSRLALRTRKDLENHLITRALKDRAFRSRLLAEPKAIVEMELGVKLPEKLEVLALEETESQVYLVLPANPYEDVSEEVWRSSGKTYEEVARLVLEQQRHSFFDEESSASFIARMWSDPIFKRRMVNDPAAVIEEEFGFSPSPGLSIQTCEEQLDRIYIIVPRILDQDLDDVYEAQSISGLNRPLLVAACAPAAVTIADSLLLNCTLCTNTTGRLPR